MSNLLRRMTGKVSGQQLTRWSAEEEQYSGCPAVMGVRQKWGLGSRNVGKKSYRIPFVAKSKEDFLLRGEQR
jgi:hypothetical protein